MEFAEEIYHLSARLTEREIARRLDLPHSTVHYWVARRGRRKETKSGRPRVTDAETDRLIVQSVIENPFASAVDIRRSVAPHVSVDTVRKRLKKKGFRCRVPAKKAYLDRNHKETRCDFGCDYFHWGIAEWSRVFFSDEKIFRCDGHGRQRVYRPTGNYRFDERFIPIPTTATQRITIPVWMGFSSRFREIHRIADPTLTADYYIAHILRPIRHILTDPNTVFMYDLSPIHTSHAATDWLENYGIDVIPDWPAKGPDMNPVENVWAELVRLTGDRNLYPDPTTSDELWQNVSDAFQSLDDQYFTNLIESMPKRMRLVVEAVGGWTKY